MVTMPADRLAERLARRPPKPRRVQRGLARLLHRAGLPTRAKGRRVYDAATEHARHRRLVTFYASPAFLADWEGRWQAHLAATLGSRLRRPFLRIESGRPDDPDAFYLVGEGAGGTISAPASSS
jgi:hypothetical protein